MYDSLIKFLGGHMNTQHLAEHYDELISFMETNDYAEAYIQRFRLAINRILSEPNPDRWESYADVYTDYEMKSESKAYLRQMRTTIGGIEQFDIYGNLPNATRRHTLFERGSYHLLIPEFKELIDFYKESAAKRGKKVTTIASEARNASTFLYHVQEKGAKNLEDITPEVVLSFFISDDDCLHRGYSYKNNIATVFKECIAWKEIPCKRIISYLPALKKRKKNIQYLNKNEIDAIREALEHNSISLRNKAIVLLLLLTGIRSSDITHLTFDSIDWENECISICQVKTALPLELPLTATIGNAIFDYITQERPATESRFVFLSEKKPYSPLANNSIENIVAKVFRIAGIRQISGSRKGTHVFRHYAASTMLESGVKQPVISRTLGHASPESLEAYLNADFVHLKECALDIHGFPVSKEVFL